MSSQPIVFDGLKKVIGLDIGSTSIKAVLLELQSGAPICRGMYCFDVPRDIGLTKPVLLEGLRNVAAAFGHETKSVALLTADRDVQLKFVEKPPMTRQQLDQVMELEMKPPPSLEGPTVELAHTYTILGQSALEERATVHLLVASFPVSWLREKEEQIREAGLSLEGVYPYPVALRECFWINYGESFEEKVSPYLIALLNLGATSNQVAVCDLQTLRLARTFPFAGDELTQSLTKTYKSGGQEIVLDRNAAEQYKVTIGILSPEEQRAYESDAVEIQVSEGIRRGMERMMQKVRLSLDYFKGQMKSQVSQAFVFGGAANLRSLEGNLQENLTVSLIQPLFPFKSVPFLPKDGQTPDPRLAPVIVPAVGAALCGMRGNAAVLNLMEGMQAERRKRIQRMIATVLVPALCGLAALLAPALYAWQVYLPHRARVMRAVEEDVRMTNEFAQVASFKAQYDQLVKQKRDLTIRTTFIQSILRKRIFWSRIFTELGTCMPPEVWLTEILSDDYVAAQSTALDQSMGGGMPGETGGGQKPAARKGPRSLSMKGRSFGFGAFSTFIKNLEGSAAFQNVVWQRSERAQAGTEIVEFSVSCELRPPAAGGGKQP
ncbi:MAG TPA: pilus assembly protein PilM [Candidatus Ozemobacteraceae bacterium]|nr:pilus assembly protein PilM [Candidatus Ozemobacteraceae bacterium]